MIIGEDTDQDNFSNEKESQSIGAKLMSSIGRFMPMATLITALNSPAVVEAADVNKIEGVDPSSQVENNALSKVLEMETMRIQGNEAEATVLDWDRYGELSDALTKAGYHIDIMGENIAISGNDIGEKGWLDNFTDALDNPQKQELRGRDFVFHPDSPEIRYNEKDLPPNALNSVDTSFIDPDLRTAHASEVSGGQYAGHNVDPDCADKSTKGYGGGGDLHPLSGLNKKDQLLELGMGTIGVLAFKAVDVVIGKMESRSAPSNDCVDNSLAGHNPDDISYGQIPENAVANAQQNINHASKMLSSEMEEVLKQASNIDMDPSIIDLSHVSPDVKKEAEASFALVSDKIQASPANKEMFEKIFIHEYNNHHKQNEKIAGAEKIGDFSIEDVTIRQNKDGSGDVTVDMNFNHYNNMAGNLNCEIQQVADVLDDAGFDVKIASDLHLKSGVLEISKDSLEKNSGIEGLMQAMGNIDGKYATRFNIEGSEKEKESMKEVLKQGDFEALNNAGIKFSELVGKNCSVSSSKDSSQRQR